MSSQSDLKIINKVFTYFFQGRQGKDIQIWTDFKELPSNESLVVQKYIDYPYLLNGRKTDIRFHVLITSVEPLHIYLFNENFVRQASEDYVNTDWKNSFIHLTNISVNKHNKKSFEGKLFTTQKFFKTLEENGIDTSKILQQAKDIILKTIISAEQELYKKNRNNTNFFRVSVLILVIL